VIGQIAAARQGQITVEQIAESGLSKDAIATRTKRGTLFREYRGVYSVGKPATTPIEKSSAAVLACGRRSALGGHSTLSLFGVVKYWPARPEVVTARRIRRKGINVRRTATLLRPEVTEHQGITTVTLARALLDVAPSLTRKRLERVVNNALHTPFVSQSELRAVCEKHPNHPGAELLVDFYDTTDGPTRSGWEDDLKRFRTEFGFDGMIVNTVVNGHEVDAYFPDERLILQLDGWPSHRSHDRFIADREQDADNLDDDRETIRITHERFYESREREAARVHRILARRRRYISLLSRA
jgi:hypothetical protein